MEPFRTLFRSLVAYVRIEIYSKKLPLTRPSAGTTSNAPVLPGLGFQVPSSLRNRTVHSPQKGGAGKHPCACAGSTVSWVLQGVYPKPRLGFRSWIVK